MLCNIEEVPVQLDIYIIPYMSLGGELSEMK